MIFLVNSVCAVVTVTVVVDFVDSSAVLFKCPKSSVKQQAIDDDSSTVTLESVIIPAHLMSHLQPAEFRLDASTHFACKLSKDIIRINLIDSNATTTTSSPLPPSSVSPALELIKAEGEASGADDSTVVYEPFSKPRNTSFHLGFMYAVDNSSVLTEDSYNNGEKVVSECNRKLSRRDVQLTPLGFLLHNGEYYRNEEFCVETINDAERWMAIRKCEINCDDGNTPCIPLCCHLHEYVDLAASCCQSMGNSEPIFQPVIYEDKNRKLSPKETTHSAQISATNTSGANGRPIISRLHYVTFKYNDGCSDGYKPHHLFFNGNGDSVLNTKIHVQTTGKVAYIGGDRKWHFLHNYCVAGIVNGESFEADVPGISEMTSLMQYCLDDEKESSHSRVLWPHYLYLGAYCVASLFLLSTALVYICLWEKQNIHGWTILSFTLSEFFLFLFLSISTALGLFSYGNTTSNSFHCVGSAILAHFFFLSTFCWLTIINLDLWWTFKSLTPLSERSKGRKRFCLYMLFAWGIPGVTVLVGVILQHIFKENSSGVVIPDYGNQQCFLATHAKGFYLYYIIGVLLLINLILIVCTFVTIHKFKKSTRMASSSSSSKNKERSLKLFLKLMFVMGVSWTLEFLVWLVNGGDSFKWYFLVIDMFNILQAVAIFVIFVCKRKIISQLEQKHPAMRVITKPLQRFLSIGSTAAIASSESKRTRSTTVSSSILGDSRKRSRISSRQEHQL